MCVSEGCVAALGAFHLSSGEECYGQCVWGVVCVQTAFPASRQCIDSCLQSMVKLLHVADRPQL